MASQVVIHAMALEIARGVSRAMENRAMRDAVDDLVEVPVEGMEEEDETGLLQLARVKNEESACVQAPQAGRLGGADGGVRRRSVKLPWRPHKAAHVSTRRRRLQRRRRSLSMDVAEWAALAGPQHQDAIFATKRVAEELRNVVSAPARPVGEVGLCRSKSNRLQALLRERGDAGALILLAGLLEILSLIILDVCNVVNVHILHRAAEIRGMGSTEEGKEYNAPSPHYGQANDDKEEARWRGEG